MKKREERDNEKNNEKKDIKKSSRNYGYYSGSYCWHCCLQNKTLGKTIRNNEKLICFDILGCHLYGSLMSFTAWKRRKNGRI